MADAWTDQEVAWRERELVKKQERQFEEDQRWGRRERWLAGFFALLLASLVAFALWPHIPFR